VAGDEEEDGCECADAIFETTRDTSMFVVRREKTIVASQIVPKLSDPTSGSHHGCHTYKE
jgi:hypothetical protein